MALADAHAEATAGWSSEGHHATHKTTDVVVSEGSSMLEWMLPALHERITPALCAQFGVQPLDIWLEDAFIIKCDCMQPTPDAVTSHGMHASRVTCHGMHTSVDA